MKKLLALIAVVAVLVFAAGKAIDSATTNNAAILHTIEGGTK